MAFRKLENYPKGARCRGDGCDVGLSLGCCMRLGWKRTIRRLGGVCTLGDDGGGVIGGGVGTLGDEGWVERLGVDGITLGLEHGEVGIALVLRL